MWPVILYGCKWWAKSNWIVWEKCKYHRLRGKDTPLLRGTEFARILFKIREEQMKFMERRGEIVRSALREIILGLWSTWTRGEIVRSVWSAIWVMTIFFPPLGVSGKWLSHIFDRPLGIPWVIWSAGGLDRTFCYLERTQIWLSLSSPKLKILPA